jgi:hypothetical protein
MMVGADYFISIKADTAGGGPDFADSLRIPTTVFQAPAHELPTLMAFSA